MHEEQIGKVFGSLTITGVERIPQKTHPERTHIMFKARCSCGTEKLFYASHILSGMSHSCGCKMKAINNDLVGRRFGNVIINSVFYKLGKPYVNTVCDCGKDRVYRLDTLYHTEYTACLSCCRERRIENSLIHGDYGTRLYNVWSGMLDRCRNNHKDYGGRGISVCLDWLVYVNFRTWAYSSGYTPELSIERIDVNGNYCPENCTWVTMKQQQKNKRNTIYVTYKGDKIPLCQSEDILGVPYEYISNRIGKHTKGVVHNIDTIVNKYKENVYGK